jgi:hypothetical protein
VLLLEGSPRLTLEGGAPIEMLPGLFAKISAHGRYRFQRTDPTQPALGLAIHYEGEAQPEPEHERERNVLGGTAMTE